MHAYWFCLVLTTLAAAQVHVATVDPWRSVLATWGNVVAWAMLAGTMFWQAKRNLANGDSRETAVDEQLLIHLQWLRWSWLAINVVAIAVFGWGAIATSLLGSDYSLTLRAFYLLLPTQVFLLGNWTMEWCWDRYRRALNNSGRAQALRSINQESPDSLRCTATKDEESPEGLCPTAIKDDNTLWKHLLMTGRLHGGWLLIPLGFVLALGDLARLLLGMSSLGRSASA